MNGFDLAATPLGPLAELPTPGELHLPLAGHRAVAEAGDKVSQGDVLAEGPYRLHAPLPGQVADIDAEHIRLDVSGSADQNQDAPIKGLYGRELSQALAELGAPVAGLAKADTLVINGVEPEPGCSAYAQIFEDGKAELKAGLNAVLELVDPAETILVVSEGSRAELLGNRFAQVPARYPMGLDPMAVKAATGRENPKDVACISLGRLFALGQVAASGRPLEKVMVSVAGKNFLAPLGTPAGHLLAGAGVDVRPGDRVVLGGPMRGAAAYSPVQGVGPLDYAVTLVPAGSHPAQTGRHCLGCGECVAVCPSRIRPDLVSRASEFGLYERARNWNIHACMECGLCSYVCTGARPVMQYILLAKQALAELDRAAAECAPGS